MQYLSIKQQILLLKAEQERFGEYLKLKHPKMLALDEASAKLGRLLGIYRDQSVEQLEAKKSALALQIQNLQKQTKQWGRENIDLGRKNAEYTRIKAKGQRLQSLYDQLLTTLQTLDVNKDISPETVTIYQAANDASLNKSFTRKGLVMAGLLGLGLGLAILMLLDRVDDRMNSFMELEESFDEDVIGQIPREKSPGRKSALPLLQADDARHPFVESYRNLRSSLLFMAETGTHPHTLLITSAVPNDGKSITAANLAITLATGGTRVLLVDADLRKGSLHSRFDIKADAGGLSETLSQGADWHKAIKETSVPKLWLLPRGAITHRSSELFIGPVMGKFLQESIKEYDYVLIDTVPVMAADDVTSLAPRVDGVIFVIRAEFTSARVPAPMLPMTERERTMIPRTTPNDLTTRYPGSSNVVVVRECVWFIRKLIEQNFRPLQKLNLPESLVSGASQFLNSCKQGDVPKEHLKIARHFNAEYTWKRSQVPKGRPKRRGHVSSAVPSGLARRRHPSRR